MASVGKPGRESSGAPTGRQTQTATTTPAARIGKYNC